MSKSASTVGMERLGHPDCAACPMRSSGLFGDLQTEELAPLAGAIDDMSVAQGTVLYEHGRSEAHVYVLRAGAVKLVQILPNGSQRIVRMPRAGDAIGLEVLVERPYQHRAVMMVAGRVCRVPKKLLQDLGREKPSIYKKLLEKWEHAVEEAEYCITSLSTGSAEARVARLLLHVAESSRYGNFDSISRDDMAAALGMTESTVSRVMAEFKRKAWVEEKARHTICDIKALRACAED